MHPVEKPTVDIQPHLLPEQQVGHISSRKKRDLRGNDAAGRHPNRSIRVTDTFHDKDALHLTLDQHGKHLIEKMAFCIRLRNLSPDDTTTNTGNPTLLSAAARDLLSGRLTGLNLRHIDIECNLEKQEASGAKEKAAKFERDELDKIFQQPKEQEPLLQLEAENPRRRLLADTWSALALNPTVRELSVDRFVPIWASSFHSTRFRSLLGRLERLDVTIFGSKDGHRCINTVPAYIDSLQSILKVLFLHCASLTRLSLHASQHAPLGGRGHYHIPLSLKATQLPRLEHLSLRNCFIGFELAHFLNGHANTLVSLELQNCYSYRGACDTDGTGGGMQWAPFLEMITRPGMKLRQLDIYDHYIPLTIDDGRLATYDPETANEPEDVKEVRRAQKKNPKRRLFLYGFLRDYSGEPWMNKEAILSSFEAGDDQWAYDRLMAVVRQNATKGLDGRKCDDDHNVVSEKNCSIKDSVEFVELPA